MTSVTDVDVHIYKIIGLMKERLRIGASFQIERQLVLALVAVEAEAKKIRLPLIDECDKCDSCDGC